VKQIEHHSRSKILFYHHLGAMPLVMPITMEFQSDWFCALFTTFYSTLQS